MTTTAISESSPSTPDDELVLHVWPGKWDLPSINADCLAAILYAQLTIPGRFVVEECTNPDLSPDGNLPYASHGLTTISTFESIVKYVKNSKIRTEYWEARLDAQQRAQHTAWLAFVKAHLGDLVACSFFTVKDNYATCLRPALAAELQAPQSYYVPDRMRNLYRDRLEASSLWNISAEEEESGSQRLQSRVSKTATNAFGNQKVLDKARSNLDILNNLLQERRYFFGSEPTALDTSVAAHILLLTLPSLPNDVLRKFITGSYPSLYSHAQRIRSLLQSKSSSSPSSSLSLSSYASEFDIKNAVPPRSHPFVPLRIRAAERQSMLSVLPPMPSIWRSTRPKGTKYEKTNEEKKYDRIRWVFYGLAALSVVGWIAATGLRISFVSEDDDVPRHADHHAGNATTGDDDDDGVEVEVEEEEEFDE